MECIDQARAALEKAETQHCTNFDKGAVFHWAERGAYVLKADAEATIARLTAERDEARASAAAAYERAAHLIECDGDAMGGKNGAACAIRSLATEAETSALAEIVKRAVDAETRAWCGGYISRKAALRALAGERG